MKVSANVSGRKMFPITIHFNNGDQHLTVDAAKELSEKLVEAIEWVKPEGARELIDKQEEIIKEMREVLSSNLRDMDKIDQACAMAGVHPYTIMRSEISAILEKTKEYAE